MTVDDASAALSEIRYTLLLVGTHGEAGPHFMVANWGTQASFDPWRFVILVKKHAHTLANAKRTGAFTINLLDDGKHALVREIMKGKGNGFPAAKGPLEAPRLEAAYTGFDCKVLQAVDVGGDHVLVVAEVVDGWKRGDGPAMTLPQLQLSYAG